MTDSKHGHFCGTSLGALPTLAKELTKVSLVHLDAGFVSDLCGVVLHLPRLLQYLWLLRFKLRLGGKWVEREFGTKFERFYLCWSFCGTTSSDFVCHDHDIVHSWG